MVRISPNCPPSPSCSALAAAGSGSPSAMSLIQVCAWKYMGESLRHRARRLGGAVDPTRPSGPVFPRGVSPTEARVENPRPGSSSRR
ncbi:hypothetical protein ACFPRL_20050 [Pseudoclavibacter helvolus]